MDRTVVRHCAAATVSLGLAAVVVLTGSHLGLSQVAYSILVVFGALAAGGLVYATDIEWPILVSIWPPWSLALVLDPTMALAGGLLAGAIGGLLAVPLLLTVGNATDDLAG